VNKGPFTVVFDVYEDLLNYGSGIYVRTAGERIGKHAVKIVGFGVEKGIKFYICEN
jgi:cathepsin B